MSSNGFIYINNLFLIIIIIIIIIIQLWWNSLFLQANWFLWNVGHRFTKKLKTGFWFCFLVLWLLLHLGSCKASVILSFESYYLVAYMQAHLCNLGKIILVVEPPSSKEKWAFSSAHL